MFFFALFASHSNKSIAPHLGIIIACVNRFDNKGMKIIDGHDRKQRSVPLKSRGEELLRSFNYGTVVFLLCDSRHASVKIYT